MPKRKTTSVQVSRPLDLIITRYATEHNIAKHEAADRIFSILYPEGKMPEGVAIAPQNIPGEISEGIAEIPEIEEPGEISDELTKTVKDLRSVNTIRALQKGLSEGESERITSRDAFELKKIEKMFGTGNNPERSVDFAAILAQQEAKFEKLLAERDVKSRTEEAEFYKKRLEERDAADLRAQEMAAALTPIREDINKLGGALNVLAEKAAGESETPPTSTELEAIKALAGNIKEGLIEAAKAKVGETESEKLTDYLESLGQIMDKITDFAKKGETPPGEFDWRTAGISTFGEIAGEAIRAYRDIEAGRPGGEGEGEEEPLSRKIIERRVYNYAMKKIAAGELKINPYEAGEELGLTPNQVWGAVEALQKRGALKKPQVKKTGKKGRKEAAAETGIEEGEIIPPGAE